MKDVNAAGGDLCIFTITYTLAPHGVYPLQLTQAVEALRYVLEQTNHSAGNVLLGGDSAGGNLVFGVLSHLAHPHPKVTPIKLSEPLAGAATIAPWTWLHPEVEGRDIYDGGDIVTTKVGLTWSKTYLGGAKPDYYTDAFDAPTSWFSTYPVRNILCTGGENEILMPMIQEFYEKVKVGIRNRFFHGNSSADFSQAGFPNTELFMGKGESHVAPVYNIYVGDNTETEQGKKLKSWLIELLK